MPHTAHNIVVIMADQLSALTLGCYGNTEVISPQIDALAADGVRFAAAYSSSPLCTPARYAFMTGQHASVCGGYDNAAYLPATMPTFAHYLRLMGYRTCLAGKMHFVGPDQLHGFEERLTTDVYPADFGWVPDWDHPEQRIDLWYHNMSSVKQAGVAAITNQLGYDDLVGAETLRAIYDHARSPDPRPLCLVTSFINPHDPYAARRHYWDLYEGRTVSMPRVSRQPAAQTDPHNRRLEKAMALDAVDISAAEVLAARRAYYANVTYVDEWVGRIRATLRDCGLERETTLVLLSDHGDMLGEHGLWYKMSFREGSCRIPLIVHRPDRYAARVVPQPVAQIDVLPTLLALAAEGGCAVPPPIDPLHGTSLLPLCRGAAVDEAHVVISEYLAEGTGAPMLMLRRGAYKYICCPGDPEQLFDLGRDPDELDNLAGSPTELVRLEDFRALAARHWNVEAVRASVLREQRRRRAVSAALRIGRYKAWDFDPKRDPSGEYTRSHLDLTRFDIESRYPRPALFEPRD